MALKRIGLGMTLVAAVGAYACEREAPIGRLGATAKGGDDRSGPYDVVPGWWKPAPDHDSTWTWGSAAGAWPELINPAETAWAKAGVTAAPSEVPGGMMPWA